MKNLLVYGNRRFIACKKLGWKTIPAKNINTGVVSDILIENIKQLDNIRTDIENSDLGELMFNIKQNGLLHPIGITTQTSLKEVDYLVLNASENIIRKDISPTEFGKVCLRLKSDYHLSINEICARFGVSRGRIETALKLFIQIPDKYKDRIGYNSGNIKKTKISATVANSIVLERLTKENMEKLLDYVRENEVTLREIRIIIKLIQNGLDIKDVIKKYKEYIIKDITLVIPKNKYSLLIDKYKTPLTHIVTGMLNNKIPLESDTFIFKDYYK